MNVARPRTMIFVFVSVFGAMDVASPLDSFSSSSQQRFGSAFAFYREFTTNLSELWPLPQGSGKQIIS